MRLGFPLSLGSKIGVPALVVVAAAAILVAKSGMATAITVAAMLVLIVVVVGVDVITYNRTPASDVMAIAKAHGYNGPPLQFPADWRHPRDLQPGEVTCVGRNAVVSTQTGMRLVFAACAHITCSAHGYVAWLQGDELVVKASGNGHQLVHQAVDQAGSTEITYLKAGTLDIKCPHFMRFSY